MKYFSTFSGIGGFELGIKRAMPSAKCVGYSEIDKFAKQIYNSLFNHESYGDITKIDADALPDFELLVGGFPCQSFSVAGKRGGFNDVRGTLFFDLARILKSKKPSYFLFENVKGLLSHDKGSTFAKVTKTITELGYDCEWGVLNSKDFGVPQHRERVFIVGHLRGKPAPKVFSIRSGDPEHSNKADQQRCANTLTGRSAGGSNRRGNYVQTDDGMRSLTPIECERLQGFPDGWTEGVSDTQRYKCLGNAVTVNVIEFIISRMFDARL